ncbi:MAG: RNA polymerase subunit sigma-70 [Bacteroidetes bacterium]|nr:MAG: RNA polymerase subunit sigma-70 [Bacteroidota bacterium]
MLDIQGKNNTQSDEALLKDFRSSGDLDVLGALYARYMHLVLGVALKYLQDRAGAQDAVMEIFEKLITTLPGHEVKNFKSWLHVLTKNHCLMHLRAQKSKKFHTNSYKDEQAFVESEAEMHPLDTDAPGMEEALQACIEKLKQEQRTCIELFYYQKRSYDEIAMELFVDVKKVKSHLQNGKRNLKNCLELQHG